MGWGEFLLLLSFLTPSLNLKIIELFSCAAYKILKVFYEVANRHPKKPKKYY